MARVRKGSSKDVHEVTDGTKVVALDIVSTGRVSIFDRGPMLFDFGQIGIYRTALSGKIFQALRDAGFKTHYLSHDVVAATTRVKPFNIYEIGVQYEGAFGRVIPLEVLFRLEVTEPMIDRALRDEEFSRKLRERVDGELVAGKRLLRPLIECSTKFEAQDRYITDKEAVKLAKLGDATFAEMVDLAEKGAILVADMFASYGYWLVDGKWEFGITYDGPDIVFVDGLSLDEVRAFGPDGQRCDKEILRIEAKKRKPVWVEDLKVAKANWPDEKNCWPPYPSDLVTEEFITDFVGRYEKAARDMGAL
jgi:phosphoribosylaminoimidazole-succinocarboxamide synthase